MLAPSLHPVFAVVDPQIDLFHSRVLDPSIRRDFQHHEYGPARSVLISGLRIGRWHEPMLCSRRFRRGWGELDAADMETKISVVESPRDQAQTHVRADRRGLTIHQHRRETPMRQRPGSQSDHRLRQLFPAIERIALNPARRVQVDGARHQHR